MKQINNYVNERREAKHYRSNGTIICNVDELDELLDIVEHGIKAVNFDLNAHENRFHIVKQFYNSLKDDLSRVGDTLELKVRLAPDEKEGDR